VGNLSPRSSSRPAGSYQNNPGGALVEPRGTAFAYPGLWLEEVKVARLSDPIHGDPLASDWNRFSHDKMSLKGKDYGAFALVEFGFPAPNSSGRPRFLAGVWYPSVPQSGTLNVNVFFSPNTGAPYPGDT
jgi:hypothetical protein